MNLPPLVFGTWRLTDHSYSPESLLAKLKSLISLGINHLDLADIYGGYTTESLIGSAFALDPSIRDKLVLISKCNIQYPCEGRKVDVHYYDSSFEHIVWSVERSLKCLGTTFLDCLLLHRPDPLMDTKEISKAFNHLKSKGLVKNFGVSNFTPHQFELIQSGLDFKLVTNQVEFSVLHTLPMFDGTFDHAQMKAYQPMIWSPLAGGRLFKNYDNSTEEGKRIERVLKVMKEIGTELGGGKVLR